jgi:RNA polymerase sigma-70 factor (ECF subfamily)
MEHFGRSLLEHAPALRRYARALTGDRSRADDLLQDCLERALRRVHQFQPGTNLKAWLFTMMHNVFISERRSDKNAPKVVALDVEHEALIADPPAGDTLDELESALAQLPPEHKEVLLLVCLEGWGYQDAARILEIPVGTVMSRLHRAREALRRRMFGADAAGAAS